MIINLKKKRDAATTLLNSFKNRSSTLNQTISNNRIVLDSKILLKIRFAMSSPRLLFKKSLLMTNENSVFTSQFF